MPRNKGFRPTTIKVPIDSKLLPRLQAVQEKYDLDPGQALELAVDLAAVASGGVLVRVFGLQRGEGGRVEHVGDVVRQMMYCGTQEAEV